LLLSCEKEFLGSLSSPYVKSASSLALCVEQHISENCLGFALKQTHASFGFPGYSRRMKASLEKQSIFLIAVLKDEGFENRTV
jgi:hypothetical protein